MLWVDRVWLVNGERGLIWINRATEQRIADRVFKEGGDDHWEAEPRTTVREPKLPGGGREQVQSER